MKKEFSSWVGWKYDETVGQLHIFFSESTLIIDKVQYLKKWEVKK